MALTNCHFKVTNSTLLMQPYNSCEPDDFCNFDKLALDIMQCARRSEKISKDDVGLAQSSFFMSILL